ncbi:hypothetical protein B7R54_10035 [Subtercola boreus]|uniref:Fluoride-specific ion channel FluC n=1 Tax=Subtercola boreus TaxID=120213 RepID=A0A3E0VNW9_9MICO|nr:CrcB family protein [Subtercola boreus]RFA11200.1 hypothetical protein B7R54_10035 [Subtercola boreus]TQL53415.1 camphor resistance protein CrcB [Subtercola boreus]
MSESEPGPGDTEPRSAAPGNTDPRDYELPYDSDVEVDDIETGSLAAPPSALPVHLRPSFLLLVGVGGAAGTLARYTLQQTVAPLGGVPVITLLINLAGAFLLGLLLETLVRRGTDQGARRVLRLLLGTGALGGFTTYSALSVDTFTLLHEGAPASALLYAFGTLVLGAVASIVGIAVGVRANRRADGRD